MVAHEYGRRDLFLSLRIVNTQLPVNPLMSSLFYYFYWTLSVTSCGKSDLIDWSMHKWWWFWPKPEAVGLLLRHSVKTWRNMSLLYDKYFSVWLLDIAADVNIMIPSVLCIVEIFCAFKIHYRGKYEDMTTYHQDLTIHGITKEALTGIQKSKILYISPPTF